MAELTGVLDAIIKYGGYPILLIWVWNLDAEQTEMKEKMFDCFQDKEDILKNRITNHENKTLFIKPYMVAVLPCKQNNNDDEDI